MTLVEKIQAGSSKFIAYFRESFAELRKVRWPKNQELFKYTWVTLVTVLVVAVLIFAFDVLFSFLLNTIGLGTSR
jgi:preprotein translocase subunit SecE